MASTNTPTPMPVLGVVKTITYTYDAVGNRLTQNNSGTLTNYTYDNANRLTNVNAQVYTWDNNGNLLNDGTRTFTYDQANRATQIISGTNTYAFAYNGVNDRLRQSVNGVPTNYALDPAAGLTQVLTDGTSTYLYGIGRIAQQQTNMQYFGADGLGSVRQLYNTSGQIIANHRYDPFGNTISQSGVGASNYGFTGEWTDATGLEYLRARYYAPTQGRFVTKDVWPEDYKRPQSLNKWIYGFDDPVINTDPSGHCSEPYDPNDPCWQLYDRATKSYGVWPWPDDLRTWSTEDLSDVVVWLDRGVRFQVDPGKEWTSVNVRRVLDGLGLVNNYMRNKTESGLGLKGGTLTLVKGATHCPPNSAGCVGLGNGIIWLDLGSGSREDRDTTIHEVGHVVDWNAGSAYPNHIWSLNARDWLDAGAWYNLFGWRILLNCKVGLKGFTGAVSGYAMSNPQEDFAETFMWVVLNHNGERHPSDNPWNPGGEPNQERLDALAAAISGLP